MNVQLMVKHMDPRERAVCCAEAGLVFYYAIDELDGISGERLYVDREPRSTSQIMSQMNSEGYVLSGSVTNPIVNGRIVEAIRFLMVACDNAARGIERVTS